MANISFHPKKIEYIDKEIFRLVDLIDKIESTKTNTKQQKEFKDSLSHKKMIDLTDAIIKDKPIIEKETSDIEPKKIVSVRYIYNEEIIGYNQEKYKQVNKFISKIYEEKDIRLNVSEDFIIEKTLVWLFNTYRLKQAPNIFSTYLLDEIHNSIEEWKFYYPILYLDIEKEFYIGDVKVEFLTEEYFEKVFNSGKKEKQQNKKEKPYKSFVEKRIGQVYATCVVNAEKRKAEEISLKKCSLAIDILKICSDTLESPHLKLSFDIDFRIKENSQNEVLCTKADYSNGTFSVMLSKIPAHHYIDGQKLLYMNQCRCFNTFSNFLSVDFNESELKKLIISAIKRYGNAISNPNLYQRIVELFTILESLLLLDTNSQIIDSLCKYGSKLIFKKPEDRKHVIELFKKMYKVRSSFIHHAKEIGFELNSLKQLQISVTILLDNLIKKVEVHKNKQSLLEEIESAILEAY